MVPGFLLFVGVWHHSFQKDVVSAFGVEEDLSVLLKVPDNHRHPFTGGVELENFQQFVFLLDWLLHTAHFVPDAHILILINSEVLESAVFGEVQ